MNLHAPAINFHTSQTIFHRPAAFSRTPATNFSTPATNFHMAATIFSGVLKSQCLAVFAPDAAQAMADLADSGVGFDAVQNAWE